jgi:hypothetical protein
MGLGRVGVSPRRGRLVSSADPAQSIPLSYAMVTVDRYDSE